MMRKPWERLQIPLILAMLVSPEAGAVDSPPDTARAGMLDAHNAVRKQAHSDLPALSWSERAAEQAQDWADTLASDGCRMRHNPALQEHGQNLFWAGARREVTTTRSGETGAVLDRTVGTRVQQIAADDVVESWASERQWYDYEADACRAPQGASCDHYTQIVWAETTDVGCGMSVCENKGQIWVCEYYPAGNVVGQRPY